MPDLMTMDRDYKLDDVSQLAIDLLDFSGDCRVWLLSGEPGAGKTTLIRQVAVQLGVNPAAVTSPTFSIVNHYEGNGNTILHFDLYRIRSERELFDLGMDEYLGSGNWCFIEWPGLLNHLQPDEYISIQIQHPASVAGDQRHVVVNRVRSGI